MQFYRLELFHIFSHVENLESFIDFFCSVRSTSTDTAIIPLTVEQIQSQEWSHH